MKIFEFIFKPKSSIACGLETAYPVQSDTLMGQVFWQIYYDLGASYLSQLKNKLKQGELLAVSSAFPTDFLPKPKLPSDELKLKPTLAQVQEAKKEKKFGLIEIKHFQAVVNNLSYQNLHKLRQNKPNAVEQKQPWQNDLVIKVAISRKTFKAVDSQLFAQREYYFNWPAYKSLSIYFTSSLDDLNKDKFYTYLNNIFTQGYGKRASTGKGLMEIIEIREVNPPQATKPNAFMVLGNYYPSKEEISKHKFNGWYVLNTKFGKLGDKKAKANNPFKKPFLFYEPGSIFKMAPSKPVVGSIAENISTDPVVWQHGQTICLGVCLSE